MADLRSLLDDLGYGEVRTLLQSGNAVLATKGGTAAQHARDISAGIDRALGMKVTVLLLSAAELAAVVDANPFAGKSDPKHLHVTFLSRSVPRNKLAQIDHASVAPDDFAAGTRVIYELRPNGVMGSHLPDWQKVLGVDATARNWNTVTKLHALTR
jgi:uncharacterized protein (DUF1697 family)